MHCRHKRKVTLVMNEKFTKLKDLLKEGLTGYPVKKTILFGSQVNGNSNEQSDFDILILVDDSLQTAAYNELKFSIHKLLIDSSFKYPVDLIVKHESAFETERHVFGALAYRVCREGIVL